MRRISLGGYIKRQRGFALPTVLIASVVLLTVLAVSITATTAVRTALKDQYYAQLAQIAGEAGVAYAKACLAANGNVPLWTDEKPLKPNTDCSGNSIVASTAQVLVVAGGGGGGNNHGGGGGAGGVVSTDAYNLAVQSYTVTVGAGGAGGSGSAGAAGAVGGNSVFGVLTANGGGGGGGRVNTNSVSQATVGGSGGGGAGTIDGGTGLPGAGKAGTAGQGNAGGNGTSDATAGNGGGGGGATAAGGAASGTGSGGGISGTGGAGVASVITGVTSYYGGGGSGGRWATGSVGAAGIGGGGLGGAADGAVGAAGTANTGGGGGGGGGGTANGGAGGSGIVVVSYPSGSGVTATGGTITNVNGNTIHTFTSTGTTSFNVTAVGAASCATDIRCYVSVKDNVRSSFSVPRPTLDAEGKAVTIGNSGYVEVTRTSTGAIWRTYTQPSVQAAVVPDLCSGPAASNLGWNNAVRASTQDTYSPSPSAQTITVSNTAFNDGYSYFRKDFNVTEAGAYTVGLFSPDIRDQTDIWIDGSYKTGSNGSLSTVTANLTPGCHVALVRLLNATIQPRVARFTASVQRQGATSPVLATSPSWRVSGGDAVHYSSPNYYADPGQWTVVRDVGSTQDTYNSAWVTQTGDRFSRFISTTHNNSGGNYPNAQYATFRDSKDVVISTPTEVRVGSLCDDSCSVYMDGQLIHNAYWSNIASTTLTIQPGVHRFGVKLYNGGSSANQSGFSLAVVSTGGTVLTRSDSRWLAANFWEASNNNYYSSSIVYEPSPKNYTLGATADVLVVAGGGGAARNAAGGGGGGGVVSSTVNVSVGSTSVTVGGGGAGAGSNGILGSNGGNSAFGSVSAIGGGAGAPRDGNYLATSGGSGGGGAGAWAYSNQGGAAGTAGQGSNGGTGTAPDQGCNATGGGGGGAGGFGGNGIAGGASGAGGAGFVSFMTGVPVIYGAGGGGSITCAGSQGVSDSGGGTNGGNGTTNRGGGGGASGGSGGSGVVIIRYRTGTVNATGGTITSANGYTVHTFTSSGTFIVTSIP